ncbi:MAG: acetyltransferase [Caldilineaceae bacterium]|nr:acetyltransferase [Caldilineaceae bacterium]MCB0140449.1 acetyltransferase [Caldilineaceae bacterium]
MKPLVIFGAGVGAKLAHYYFTHDTARQVAAFTVDRPYWRATTFQNLPVIPADEVRAAFPPVQYDLFVALSYAKMNRIRAERYYEAKEMGYHLVSYISSKCTLLTDNPIGDNCFILEDNTIQPFATIGNNVTLWSGNHIGHDAVIEDHCYITSHVVIAGHVHVGAYSFLGVNATIRNDVKLGRQTLVGMGAAITKDTEEQSVYLAPRAIKARVTSDKIEL